MPLLKRSAASPRTVRPRVFLSKADRKVVNALRPIEKLLGYATAAYAAISMLTIVLVSDLGFAGNNQWRLPIGLGFAAVLALFTRFTNRWLAGIGAIGLVYGAPWGKSFLFAAPALGYFVWLNLRIFKDQKAKTAERALEGDYGMDPRSAAARDRRAKTDERVKEDATGRTLASKSKRYTPPKVAKKK